MIGRFFDEILGGKMIVRISDVKFFGFFWPFLTHMSFKIFWGPKMNFEDPNKTFMSK